FRVVGEPTLVCQRPRTGLGFLWAPPDALPRNRTAPGIRHSPSLDEPHERTWIRLHLECGWALSESRVFPGPGLRGPRVDGRAAAPWQGPISSCSATGAGTHPTRKPSSKS